jgi:hypothetical protein
MLARDRGAAVKVLVIIEVNPKIHTLFPTALGGGVGWIYWYPLLLQREAI